MLTSNTETQVAIAREYAEALVSVLRRTVARFATDTGHSMARPIAQYASILAEKLGVGLPSDVDGVDRLALSEALHALQHLGCYLDRAKHVEVLSPTRHALINELHNVTVKEVTLLLRAQPP